MQLLNKLSVSDAAELSKLSKSYISQVKHGIRPPSDKLIQALLESSQYKNSKYGQGEQAVDRFLKSRRDGLSRNTVDGFYRKYLTKAIPQLGLAPTPERINAYIKALPCSQGGRHAYYRALRVFYGWLYSPKSGLSTPGRDNPMEWVDAPKVPKRILPSLTKEQVEYLIGAVESPRDKAVIALLAESGLRLSELAGIKASDIDWNAKTIRTIGKGNKEAYAPFGSLSEGYLMQWLSEYQPNGQGIWGLNRWGISIMLQRLKSETGLPCNPHTFRRTFAVLLRRAGVDCLTIRDLGRWESVSMVERYTRSFNFSDAMKFYRGTLSG